MNANLALQSNSAFFPATSFFLSSGTFILGRSSKCDLVVKHDTVSRRHAEIAVKQDAISVRDLGSRNGIIIANKRVLTETVRPGQSVKFGSVAFMLALAEEANDESDSEETAENAKPDLPLDLTRYLSSKAQRRVLELLLEGLAEKKVAARLNLSSTTVHNHIQAIYRILKVHSRPELLAQLFRKVTYADEPPA
jgi:DNA-binding CsgD family transcriptional regulator